MLSYPFIEKEGKVRLTLPQQIVTDVPLWALLLLRIASGSQYTGGTLKSENYNSRDGLNWGESDTYFITIHPYYYLPTLFQLSSNLPPISSNQPSFTITFTIQSSIPSPLPPSTIKTTIIYIITAYLRPYHQKKTSPPSTSALL